MATTIDKDIGSSIVDSSNKNRNLMIAFLVVELYLLVTVIGTTDRHLFIKDSIFEFPFVNISIPLVGFYVLAPLLLSAFHFNILFNFLEHCIKLKQWRVHGGDDDQYDVSLFPAFILNFREKYSVGAYPFSVNYYLLNSVVVVLLSILPLFILFLMLWRFAAYQSWVVTLWHFLVVMFNIFLQVTYWFRVYDKNLLGDENNSLKALVRKISKNKFACGYLGAFLLVSFFRLLMLVLTLTFPGYIYRIVHLPYVSGLVPHLSLDGLALNAISSRGGASAPEISQGVLLADGEGDNDNIIPECSLDRAYRVNDFSGRNLRFIELNNAVLCEVDFTSSDLYGAQMNRATFSGVFNLSNLSYASLSRARIQKESQFAMATLNNADLEYIVANEVNFTLANLHNVDLLGSKLRESRFFQAQLHGATFILSDLTLANLVRADTHNAKFIKSPLVGVDLRDVKHFDPGEMLQDSPISNCLVYDVLLVQHIDEFFMANCNVEEKGPLSSGVDNIETELSLSDINRNFQETSYESVRGEEDDHTRILVEGIISAASLSNARRVDLSFLDMESVPSGLLALKKLEVLNLSGNRLDASQVELIAQHLPNLKELDLGYNKLTSVPAALGTLTQLVSLDLKGNKLTNVPKELGHLKHLNSLNLRANELTALPLQILQLKKLGSLDIRANKLDCLPKQLEKLTQLTELYLGGNQLEALPPELWQLKQLTVLDLNWNQLEDLPSELGELKKLELLNLRGNQLQALPPEFWRLKQLTVLDLNWNQLEALPSGLGELKQLEVLNLRGNQLEALPPGLWQLKQLTVLDLNWNQLKVLPSGLGELKQLELLNLRGNQLEALPPEFWELAQLDSIDLGANKLTALPKELGQLEQLTVLDLNSNQLDALPPELGQLEQLTVLDLNSNRLEALPPELGQLKQLTKLDLFGNNLTALPSELGQLKQLRWFDVSSNQLTALPKELGQLKQLRWLGFHRNRQEIPPTIEEGGASAVLGWLTNEELR